MPDWLFGLLMIVAVCVALGIGFAAVIVIIQAAIDWMDGDRWF